MQRSNKYYSFLIRGCSVRFCILKFRIKISDSHEVHKTLQSTYSSPMKRILIIGSDSDFYVYIELDPIAKLQLFLDEPGFFCSIRGNETIHPRNYPISGRERPVIQWTVDTQDDLREGFQLQRGMREEWPSSFVFTFVFDPCLVTTRSLSFHPMRAVHSNGNCGTRDLTLPTYDE